jgi:hypothetical protein
MSTQNGGPSIAKSGLRLYVDPANSNSYNGGVYAYDMIGTTGLTFSLNNTATFSTTNSGTFQLDGITSTTASVVISNIPYPITSKMTWDVWFKRTNDGNIFNMVYSTNLPYLAFRGSSNNNFLFSWYTLNISGATQSQQSMTSPGTYSNNNWYNVTCTLDQNVTSTTSTANMYVDGLLVATKTTAVGTVDTVYQPGQSLHIGNYPGGIKYPFTGNIGPLKVYNRILSASEILQNYNTLKARFPN